MKDIQNGYVIFLPPYEDLLGKFGIKDSYFGETINVNPDWDANGDMIKMCGMYHTVLKATESTIALKNKRGDIYSFAKEIFNMDSAKEKDIFRNKEININKILIKQIIHRYQMVAYNKLKISEKKYGIIDSVYPLELLQKDENLITEPIRQGCVAISERIAKDLDIPQLHISELATFYGETKTSISKMLLAVKKKQFNLLIIGYGGTGTNFLHWLSKMAEWTNTHHIFEKMIIADDDYFDSTNLLRVPFILPETHGNNLKKKIYYFKDYAGLTKRIEKRYHNIDKNNLMEDYIYYGAPDLDTRKMLYEKNARFIAATHRDNQCSLMLRPKLDTELMIETYGKITLTPFFMNHIKMTIEFIKYLSDPETTMESMLGEEKSILSFDFTKKHTEEIEHGIRLSGRTVYPVVSTKHNTAEIEVRGE